MESDGMPPLHTLDLESMLANSLKMEVSATVPPSIALLAYKV